ncbi:MAG: glycosyltransferase [Coriobacteriia bacterium]|nr:glycosyltransferase [Coriobacteriia bacterium]
MLIVEDYLPIVGKEVIGSLHAKARKLYGKRVMHVNATYYGGGVAEMLQTFVPLMNNIGIDADWRIVPGPVDFFNITKQFHNGLHGQDFDLTEEMKKLYVMNNGDFATYAKLDDDIIIIHDPQPLPLIRFYAKRQPWIWRCHVDLTNPHSDLWEFLAPFILRYDRVVVSHEDYVQKDLPNEHVIQHPAIDPLALKNRDMEEDEIALHLFKLGVPADKPYILQVSRFDKWKDMPGVIETFKRLRDDFDCRVVLCGSMASDDPEGIQIYQQVVEDTIEMRESGDVILVTDASNAEVNALQRGAAVVTQKSSREGFGLTVTEAMWKAKPVVSTTVGGIPLQIEHEKTGLLSAPDDFEGFVRNVRRIMEDPGFGAELGRAAKEKVRTDFLITRMLSHDLDMLNDLLMEGVPPRV